MHATLLSPAHQDRRVGLAGFSAAIALSAWGGAAGLIVGFLSLGPAVTSRLPLASPVLGGVALALVVAIPMTVIAELAWRGDARSGPAAVIGGILQIGWIVVELMVIQELSFFHPLYVLIGLALVVIGGRPQRP